VTQRLADLTTLRVGGEVSNSVVAASEVALIDAVSAADAAGTPVLLLGAGSNVVCSDDGFDGLLVRVATRGIARIDDDQGAVVSVQAGEPWDELVAWSVAEGLTGLEALSGIPGLVGATPVQNVGAYGQEVSSLIASVVAFDRSVGSVVHLECGDCGFAYRDSRFKHEPDRWVILEVTFALEVNAPSVVRYEELARVLGVSVGESAPAADVRSAVLQLRRAKGMVLDPSDHDTWSVGSFFTNPIVSSGTASRFPLECPRYTAENGVKLSAAWLIESAGITRRWAVTSSAPARVSGKHVLALTNRGDATAADVLELARAIRERVRDVHAITLEIEPRLVGYAL
jgi:UDP-N-acetylmuramate dehydrogenase